MSHKRLSQKHKSQSSNRFLQLPLISPPTEKVMDVCVLERLLDDVSEVLKDSINKGEEKSFLLPLLFYKYFSDLSNASLPEFMPFYLPSEYGWENISSQLMDSNINIRLSITKAMNDIASSNSRLQSTLNFTNYEEYSDILLKKLIIVISRYQFVMVKNLNLWSKTYEYLLQRFPEKKQGVEEPFYTPRDVVMLMVGLIKPSLSGQFYDPACGSGCLSGVFHCLCAELTGQQVSATFVGQNRISIASAIAKMDLFFSDAVKIYDGDPLCKPLCGVNGDLRNFDYIFTNPPWNQTGYSKTFYERDPLKRFHYGILDGKKADWGWVQHILASLERNRGKAAVILDMGALSRGSGSEIPDSECGIRAAITKQDIIEAVITLPGNLFYGITVPCCLLLFALDKSSENKEKVLFIDAQKFSQTRRGSKRIELKQEELGAIIETYSQRKIEEGFSQIASLEDIRSHDYDLRPIVYTFKEVHIDYRKFGTIEQEVVEAHQVRISSNIKILKHLSHPYQEVDYLDIVLKEHMSVLNRCNLNGILHALLEDIERSREQELTLEVELREAVSRDIFALDMKKVKLGNHANVRAGFSVPEVKREKDGKTVPWVKAGDLEQEYILEVEGCMPEILTTTKDNSNSTHAVQPVNTILLAIYGGISTVGKTAILGVPAVTNQAVCCIRPFEDVFDPYYLFCYLIYMRRHWTRFLVGSRQGMVDPFVKSKKVPSERYPFSISMAN